MQDDSLRLKASLQRCKRVTDGFAEALLDAYADRASKLGHALGMPDEVTNVFTEAEIRCAVRAWPCWHGALAHSSAVW